MRGGRRDQELSGATQAPQVDTGICLVIDRDPITTAKDVATLDRISGSRFLFGIGGGWNAEEMANHGTEWKTRRCSASACSL